MRIFLTNLIMKSTVNLCNVIQLQFLFRLKLNMTNNKNCYEFFFPSNCLKFQCMDSKKNPLIEKKLYFMRPKCFSRFSSIVNTQTKRWESQGDIKPKHVSIYMIKGNTKIELFNFS